MFYFFMVFIVVNPPTACEGSRAFLRHYSFLINFTHIFSNFLTVRDG